MNFIPRSNGFLVAGAVLLAVLHAILGFTAKTDESVTADEIAYLTAGHTYNSFGDFRLHPENGNLPQRWIALPELMAHIPLPSVKSSAWSHADVWQYGHQFLYEQSEPMDQFLFYGRVMISVFSAATGLLIFFWSRSLFGRVGAFISLLLFCFSPSFLAHGSLATSDVPMAFFFLAAVGAWWRHLTKPSLINTGLSSVVFGLACITKYSAILLFPIFGLIGLLWLVGLARATGWRRPLAYLGCSTLIHLSLGWCVIWLFYNFRYSAFAPAIANGANFYQGGWAWLLSDDGWLKSAMTVLRQWRALPEAFLYGGAFVAEFSHQRSAFLNGNYSINGWPEFFPYTFLVKTTGPLLLLFAAAGLTSLISRLPRFDSAKMQRVRLGTQNAMPLLVLFAVYWLFSVTSHLNIGHRHLLPTYPVLFILVGSLGVLIETRRPITLIAVGGLIAWHIVESNNIRPNYLAYFNSLAGGPANGWRHLVDSSLDWGQDLPGLANWLQVTRRPLEPVYLSYFGTGDPDYYGVRAIRMPMIPRSGTARPWYPLRPGIYALSATMLQQVYLTNRGPWTPENERRYQQLRRDESAFHSLQSTPHDHPELLRDRNIAQWQSEWKTYDELRFARLCHYLRARQPDAMIGYSILIFRITQHEIDAATAGSSRDLGRAIEHALARQSP